jgi:hypothetical protein
VSDDDLNYTIASLRLSALISRADVKVALEGLKEVCRLAGVEAIDGLPLPTWIAQGRQLALEEELFAIEDKEPALAAMLQQHLDDVKKKGGIVDPE